MVLAWLGLMPDALIDLLISLGNRTCTIAAILGGVDFLDLRWCCRMLMGFSLSALFLASRGSLPVLVHLGVDVGLLPSPTPDVCSTAPAFLQNARLLLFFSILLSTLPITDVLL